MTINVTASLNHTGRFEPQDSREPHSPSDETTIEDLPLHVMSAIMVQAGYWRRHEGPQAWWHASSHASTTRNEIFSCALVCHRWKDALCSEPLVSAGLLSATFGMEEGVWRAVLRGQSTLLSHLFTLEQRKAGSLNDLLKVMDKNQRSMLSRASELGHVTVVGVLLTHIRPWQVLVRDQLSRHAGHWAAARGRQEVLRQLIQHVSISNDCASQGGVDDESKDLFDHQLWILLFSPDCNGQTLIQLASYNGHLEAAKVILGAMQSFAFTGSCVIDLSVQHEGAGSSHSPHQLQPSHITGRGGGVGLGPASSSVQEGTSFLPPPTIDGKTDDIEKAFEWMVTGSDPMEREVHDTLISDLRAGRSIWKESLVSSLELCRKRKYVPVFRAILLAQKAIGISIHD